MSGLPDFEHVRSLRPVALIRPGSEVPLAEPGVTVALPRPAASAALVAEAPAGPLTLRLASGETRLDAVYADGRVRLHVTTDGRTSVHHSRRWGRANAPEAVALTLTGDWLTVLTRDAGEWTARGHVHLLDRVDVRDEKWLAGLGAAYTGTAERVTGGAFGQLGLRDPRIVSHADGSPYLLDGRLLLALTSAGPGFAEAAHTSIWSLDPDELTLEHRSDLYFRRDGGVYADHATHLVRDGDAWLVATSTWDGFDASRRDARVSVVLARSEADVLTGEHVLDAAPWPLPTDGLDSVGVWDPHLVHDPDEGWLVGYVSARRYFDFFPVLAGGPSLDALTLRGAAPDRRATEGTTLVRVDGAWRVLASDGRDNPRALRETYPVFDLEMRQIGTVTAPYPTNIPWPTVVETTSGAWLMIGFDGEPCGGSLAGYGTHGALRISRG